MKLKFGRSGSIPLEEISFTYVKSSGPGGQNVNKSNTKAVLKWNLLENQSINETLKQRLTAKLDYRLNEKGEITITSDKFRVQKRNGKDCLEKLISLLEKASRIPKKRVKTKPSRAAKEKRLQKKKRHSQQKRTRKKPSFD